MIPLFLVFEIIEMPSWEIHNKRVIHPIMYCSIYPCPEDDLQLKGGYLLQDPEGYALPSFSHRGSDKQTNKQTNKQATNMHFWTGRGREFIIHWESGSFIEVSLDEAWPLATAASESTCDLNIDML